MGASFGKDCDSLTYDEYKEQCSKEVADIATNKCPSISVNKNKCMDLCISYDENPCKGYSILGSKESQYIDSNGNCGKIPLENCPILKYRSTDKGNCKALPTLKTCEKAFSDGDITYKNGYILDPLYNKTQCPQNKCTTSICKPKAMTCLEKVNKYTTLKCPDNSLLKENLRVETTDTNTLTKQFRIGGDGKCCKEPPSCLQYIVNNNVSCPSGKFFDPHVDCSSFKTEADCKKHACVFKNNKCSSADNITDFKNQCCSQATCTKLNQGYCRKTDNKGELLDKTKCSGNFEKKQTCGSGKKYDSGKGDLQPGTKSFNDTCCSFKTCKEQNIDFTNLKITTKVNINKVNNDGKMSKQLCNVHTTESKCNQMNGGLQQGELCTWKTDIEKCVGCSESDSGITCPTLGDLKQKLCGSKYYDNRSNMDKPDNIYISNLYKKPVCQGIDVDDNNTCGLINSKNSCISKQGTDKRKVEDTNIIMAGKGKYGTDGYDENGNLAKVYPHICKWVYNDGGLRKSVTIKQGYNTDGDFLDGIPIDEFDSNDNQILSGCCREKQCNNLVVSKGEYEEGNYDILGRKINAQKTSGDSTTEKICPGGYVLDTKGNYKAEPVGENHRTSCIGKDSGGLEIETKHNITKEACTLSNKANVFDGNTNSITSVEFKETCCKPITCKIYKDAVIGRKLDSVTINQGDLTCESLRGFKPNLVIKKTTNQGLYSALEKSYAMKDGDLNHNQSYDKSSLTRDFKNTCCSPVKCDAIKGSTSPKYTCKSETIGNKSVTFVFNPESKENEYRGNISSEFTEGFQGGKLVEGQGDLSYYAFGSNSATTNPTPCAFGAGYCIGNAVRKTATICGKKFNICYGPTNFSIQENKGVGNCQFVKTWDDGIWTETNITNPSANPKDNNYVKEKEDYIHKYILENVCKTCCKPFEPTCSDVLSDGDTIHDACGTGYVPDIYNCSGSRCIPKTLNLFSIGEKMVDELDVTKKDNFKKTCCIPKVSWDSNNNYCQGNKTVDSCWSVCSSDNKVKTHTERISPPKDTVFKRNEEDDGSDGSLCRPAFGHKKFETNFTEQPSAKNECKLKITREIGKCVSKNKGNKGKVDECIAGVVNSRVCSVSKNGGGRVSGGRGWDGSKHKFKEYIEEPGSCSSYAWDVGLEHDTYKETKLFKDVQNDHSGDREALTDVRVYNSLGAKEGNIGVTHATNNLNMWPNFGTTMYREQLPISYQVDSSILESIRKKEGGIGPMDGYDTKGGIYKINKVAGYHIPITDDDLYAPSTSTVLPGDQTLKMTDNQEKLTKGAVPKTFPASLRAWQGYKTVDETGNFTVSVEDKSDKEYTVQMPSQSGYNENTKNENQAETHIPFGGVGYGAEFLDTKCFISDNKLSKNPKCKETIFNFSEGTTDEEKLTSQCPVDMYYDVNKGEKTLSTDGSFIDTVKEFSQECCTEEPKICEKMNLAGISQEDTNNYRVTGGKINVNSSDIFELWKINKTALIKDGTTNGNPGKPFEDTISTSYSENPLFMKRSNDPDNKMVCDSQDDVCLSSVINNLQWWKHIDGLHGYGVNNLKSHYDLSSEGKVSVINSKPGTGINRVQGHTVGCWTKCDANYVNNKLQKVAKMQETCQSIPSDGVYVEDTLKDALDKCESLFRQNITDEKIRRIQGMNKSQQKHEIEKLLANRDQCAVFQIPENPGYEFSLDENTSPTMPSDYRIPQNINDAHKFNNRYKDGTGFNKLQLAKIKPDLFKSVCPGKWIAITESLNKDRKVNTINLTAGSNIKNKDEKDIDTPFYQTYNETYEKETFQDEIKGLVENKNVSEDEFSSQITEIVKAYFIYLCISGYKEGATRSEVNNNNKIIKTLKDEGVQFEKTTGVPTRQTLFVKTGGTQLEASDGDVNIYNAFVNKIDTTTLYSSYAKGGENIIDLRAGPNSANTINGKQVSLVYNNRCALTSLVNNVQLSDKVTDDSDSTVGSVMFDELKDIPTTPTVSITTQKEDLDVSGTISEDDITLKSKRTLDQDVNYFTDPNRVTDGHVMWSWDGSARRKNTDFHQTDWYHPRNWQQRDAYHFPHYEDIPTAFASAADRKKYQKTATKQEHQNNQIYNRCNQIKYRHGIIPRKGTNYMKPTTYKGNMGSKTYNKNNGPTLFGTYNWGGTQLTHRYQNNDWSNWNIHYFTNKRLEPNDYSGSTYNTPYNEILGCANTTQMQTPLDKDTDDKLSEFWGETPGEKKERHRRICSHMKLFQDSYKHDTSPSNSEKATKDYNASINALDCDGTNRNIELLNYGDITQCQQIIDTYGITHNYVSLLPNKHERKGGWRIYTPNWGNYGHINDKASRSGQAAHKKKIYRDGTYYYGRNVYGVRGDLSSFGEAAPKIWGNLCANAGNSELHKVLNAPSERKKWFEGGYNTKNNYNQAVPRKGKKLPGETHEQMENREFNICANINYAAGLKRVGHPPVFGCNCDNMNTCDKKVPCKKVWDALECGVNNRFQRNNAKKNTAYKVTKLSGNGCEHGNYVEQPGKKFYLGPSLREHPIHNKLQVNNYRQGTPPHQIPGRGWEIPDGSMYVISPNPYGEPFISPNCSATSR
jgi:hypothetical protein